MSTQVVAPKPPVQIGGTQVRTPTAPPEKKIDVASVTSDRALTDQERKAHFRKLREKSRLAQDQSTVIGDPNMHYFWAACGEKDEPELIRLQSLGYTIVKEPDPAGVKAGQVQPQLRAAGLRDDGTYVRGDVILMQVPQEDYEFLLLEIEERHEQGLRAVQQEFLDSAEQAGAPTFTVSKK